MPSPHPSLCLDTARRLIAERCTSSTGDGLVGVEIEWLPVGGPRDRRRRAELIRDTLRAVGAPPAGGAVTYEPGGQVELSSVPKHGPTAACEATATDAQFVCRALGAVGVGLLASGMQHDADAVRVLDAPRYEAMEAYFDERGPSGRAMMRSTAALQVNVDVGTGAARERRWRLANALAPRSRPRSRTRRSPRGHRRACARAGWRRGSRSTRRGPPPPAAARDSPKTGRATRSTRT